MTVVYFAFVVFIFLGEVGTGEAGVLVGNSTTPVCNISTENIKQTIGADYDEIHAGLLNGTLLLIDVRNNKELKENGMIEGSRHIPLADIHDAFQLNGVNFLEKYAFVKPGHEDEFVVSCKGGGEALRAWIILEGLGYCNAKVYFGSFKDWTSMGGPVVFM